MQSQFWSDSKLYLADKVISVLVNFHFLEVIFKVNLKQWVVSSIKYIFFFPIQFQNRFGQIPKNIDLAEKILRLHMTFWYCTTYSKFSLLEAQGLMLQQFWFLEKKIVFQEALHKFGHFCIKSTKNYEKSVYLVLNFW